MQPDADNDYIDWKGWGPDAFGAYSNEERIQFTAEIQRSGVALSPETQVLEVGFGNGAFAGWIRQFTRHYVGLEASKTLVRRANAAGITAYQSSAGLNTLPNGKVFDLIVAFDVIEHLALEDIIAMLRTWRERLSNEGRILIRIPSGDSPFSGRLMYGDITHKTLLGTTALQQLASLVDLKLIATYPPALPILGLGPRKAVERAIVAAARKIATSLVNSIFHGNRHGVVTSNLVAIFKKSDAPGKDRHSDFSGTAGSESGQLAEY